MYRSANWFSNTLFPGISLFIQTLAVQLSLIILKSPNHLSCNILILPGSVFYYIQAVALFIHFFILTNFVILIVVHRNLISTAYSLLQSLLLRVLVSKVYVSTGMNSIFSEVVHSQFGFLWHFFHPISDF